MVKQYTGRPSKEDIEDVQSPFANTMLQSIHNNRQKDITSLFPTMDPAAVELMMKCLAFNPKRRISAQKSLEHKWFENFHDPSQEPSCDRVVNIPLDDNIKLKVADYRDKLYDQVLKKKKDQRRSEKSREEARRVRDSRAASGLERSSTKSSGLASREGSSTHGHGVIIFSN